MTFQLGNSPSMCPLLKSAVYSSCMSTVKIYLLCSTKLLTIKSGLLPDTSIKNTPNVVIGICK